MDFSFEYIYYRLTRLYFKWDGRKGITSIISIAMIQMVLLMILTGLLLLIFFRVDIIFEYIDFYKYFIGFSYVLFLVLAYRKYTGRYNQLRLRWKNESRKIFYFKGLIVLLSLVVPWVLFVLIIVNRDLISSVLYIGSI